MTAAKARLMLGGSAWLVPRRIGSAIYDDRHGGCTFKPQQASREMHVDPLMPVLVGATAAVLLLGLVLRKLRQPPIVAYLLTGVALGPSGVGVMTDPLAIFRFGEIGVVLLLFFIGMEVPLSSLAARWKIPVVGTFLQIAISVAIVAAIGSLLGWDLPRIILFGFVISLSSTAVVMRLFQTRDELSEPISQSVVGVLLIQDIAIIPMMTILAMMAGGSPELLTLASQFIGGVLAIAILLYIARRPSIQLPIARGMRLDRELQVFAAGLLCFGLALISGLLGLTVALGAFVGGAVVGAARETKWIHEALYPFQVLFLAMFFVAVGMAIDLRFLVNELGLVVALVVTVIITNTAINALIFKLLGNPWRDSAYGGAALAQVGEFSFVLAAIGREIGLMGDYNYEVAVLVISLSLLIGPTWIAMANWFRRRVPS